MHKEACLISADKTRPLVDSEFEYVSILWRGSCNITGINITGRVVEAVEGFCCLGSAAAVLVRWKTSTSAGWLAPVAGMCTQLWQATSALRQ